MDESKQVILGKPQEKQKEFLLSKARYTAYGGARGGGKSWALRYKIICLCVNNPGIKVLLIRRTYQELRENHINIFLHDIPPEAATYREMEKTFIWSNGSRIRCGYMDNDNDVLQYQGQEFDIICIDEATQISEYQFQTLKACMRGANDFPKRMYLTCNPGGIGHEWVKRLFIDREYKASEKAEDYCFIRSTVYDNPALLEQDGGYIDMLQSLPESLRRAWLDGEWDVFDGQFFRNFDENVHVSRCTIVPSWQKRYVAFDYGLDMLAVVWGAIDNKGNVTIYREFQQPDMVVADAAKKILELTGDEHIEEIYAPPDLWSRTKDSGKSIIEIFRENGVDATRANADRIIGWAVMMDAMRVDENGECKLHIMDNCRDLIRNIPLLQHDSKNVNDVSTQPHIITHITDALRYLLMARMRDSQEPARVKTKSERMIEAMISHTGKRRRKTF